jgi:hypothetical protein
VLLSNITFFLGLAALPLADGVALFFVAPLLITALSVPLLGEKVGPRRWAAVGAGLLGVAVMMRPGEGALQPAAVLVLVAALAYALVSILTRRMAPTEGALAMSFWTQVGFIARVLRLGPDGGDCIWCKADNASLDFLLRRLGPGPPCATGRNFPAPASRSPAEHHDLPGLTGPARRGSWLPSNTRASPMAVVWGCRGPSAPGPGCGRVRTGIALIARGGAYTLCARDSAWAARVGLRPPRARPTGGGAVT